MPRASNARELSSVASSRPDSRMPSTGAATAPTTGRNPVSTTPIDASRPSPMRAAESRTERQNPAPCSGTLPPSSSSTARQMRS